MLDVLRAFSGLCLFLDKIAGCVHEVADWRVWEDQAFCFYLACVCVCVCVWQAGVGLCNAIFLRAVTGFVLYHWRSCASSRISIM